VNIVLQIATNGGSDDNGVMCSVLAEASGISCKEAWGRGPLLRRRQS